jgi:Uma2 family endonuclease
LHVVPDVVFEILSRSTASRDRGEKKAIYAANGVRQYWIVDTRAREVLVFDLEGGRYGRERVFALGEHATSLVLGGLEIPVAEIMP